MGIGETSDERVDTLFAIRELSDRYGHIQEAIIQPFHPKTTPRCASDRRREDDVVGWVALARLVLGRGERPGPPNLAKLSGERLLDRLLRAAPTTSAGSRR